MEYFDLIGLVGKDIVDFLLTYSTPISLFFAIYLLFYEPRRIRKKGKSNLEAANLLVTWGILGTFLGVFIGLLGFDTSNVSGSVPELLTGLKLAFITSIAGMIGHIILKSNPTAYGYNNEIEEDVGNAIIESLLDVNLSINKQADSVYKILLDTKDEQNKKFEELTESFNEFAEKVVADSTQSLIDALQEVIKDFNQKITEQFGDNFKELNAAVKAMVEWQQNYKEQIVTTTQTLNSVKDSLVVVETSLDSINRNNSSISETHGHLNNVIKEVSSATSSLSEIGNKAKTSLPLIEEHMEGLVKTSGDFIQESAITLRTQYDSFANTQKTLVRELESVIEKMIQDNKERIVKLDEELGNELTKSLTALGNQLTSLSNHFVEDYKPLTEELKKVVQISKGINR